MGIFLLATLCCICSSCWAEMPTTVCGNPKEPYKTPENTCANFSEICVKKNDPVCDNFMNLCSQCPPNNFSAILFLDVKNMKNQISQLIDDRKKIFESIENKKIEALSISIIIIILFMLALMVIEVGFKLFSKCKELFVRRNNTGNYEIIKGRKNKKDRIINVKFNEIDEKFDRILGLLLKASSTVNETSIMFRINSSNENTELTIKVDDCIVKIKKQICAKLFSANPNYYKMMKLKYNGNILDDNRCLLPYITDRKLAVGCEIDHSIDASGIVIIKLKGNTVAPRLYQTRMTDKIIDLKKNIFGLVHYSDYLFAKESNVIKDAFQIKQYKILEDESTIGECELTDGSLVKVIKRSKGKLSIKSIFEEKEVLIIYYSNEQLVSLLTTLAENKFNSEENNFHLFLNDEYLEKNNYIFEYDINEEAEIKYICMMKLENKLEINESVDKGFFAEIFKGKITLTKKDTLIMKYDFSPIEQEITEMVPKGIKKHLLLRKYPRFVQLYGMYYREHFLYVSMEYLSGETLTTKLNENNYISTDRIIQWSKEILEIIKNLHDNGIVYRYFTTYSFLMDTNDSIKFFSFHLSEYLDKAESQEEMLKRFKSSRVPFVYLSPEIRDKKPINKPTDIWSFGVLLVDIINRKTPSINLDEIEEIIQERKVKEMLPDWVSDKIKCLIESCLRIDPNERSTADQLFNYILE